MMRTITLLPTLLVTLAAALVHADDIGVIPTKLIVVDKLAAAGRAKLVYVSKDQAAGITKGTGTDVGQISIRFDVIYGNGGGAGAFTLPAGAGNGTDGWLVNKDTVAKYLNKDAPGGATQAKVAVIKPGKLLKLVGKGIGDVPLDVVVGGDPGGGGVQTAYCVMNGGERYCHCSDFTGCTYKPIASGTGAKLVCHSGVADALCPAAPSACYVDTGLTVIDTCNGLEWEKKETAVNSGTDAGNLHDGDNGYSWAGRCTGPNADRLQNAFCQPSAAAAAGCAAQTGGALGCDICGPGEGTCDVAVNPIGGGPGGAITTIWEWITQVNASGFAGHADWRLPTSAGDSGFSSGEAPEAESILDPTEGYCGGGAFDEACIDPIFGPTWGNSPYWTATSYVGMSPNIAVVIHYHSAAFPTSGADKNFGDHVRAVRPSP
jgi:hypothetical protein